jgi:hypothetical protein
MKTRLTTLDTAAIVRDCTVSMVGQDGRTYETMVEASSLFDAAARALEQWSRLWWYRPNGFVEVRLDDKCWRVSAETGQRVAV